MHTCVTGPQVKTRSIASIPGRSFAPLCSHSPPPTLTSSGSLWSLPSLQTSFACHRTSYKWNLTVCAFFVAGSFHSMSCLFLRFFHIACQLSSTHLRQRLQFVSSFSCGWAPGLLPLFDNYEDSCCEHFCTSLCTEISLG